MLRAPKTLRAFESLREFQIRKHHTNSALAVVSFSSARLAHEYGFTDLDGSRPDIWRYIEDVRETGRHADLADYR